MFEQFPLNTTKHLDYLAFKKAFFMFLNRKTSELNKQDLYSEIIELKNKEGLVSALTVKRIKAYSPKSST